MTWGNFRPDSVSEAYKKMKAEELKGNQHKLDKNKNGKLDSDDFKKLRNEDAVEEDVNKSDIPAYKRKDDKLTLADLEKERTKNISHSVQLAKNNGTMKKEDAEVDAEELVEYETKDGVYKHQAKAGRYGGSEKESDYVKGPSDAQLKKIEAEKKKVKNEEVEELDELSKTTLGSYVKKAKDDVHTKVHAAQDAYDDLEDADSRKHSDTAAKRVGGIKKAVSKLTKEETQELDELSKTTLGSYINKATKKLHKNSEGEAKAASDGNYKKAYKHSDVIAKRDKGIDKAADRLAKEGLDLFSEREIDTLINEVLKASDDAGKWISDFVGSDNPKFAGKSKEDRKKQALAAYYAAQKKESVDYDSFIEEEVDLVKTSAKEIKHANIKDKDDDKDTMEPRAQGEKDFLNKLSVNVTDDPAAAAGNDQTGSSKVSTASKPTAQGAGKYDGKGKTGVKEDTSESNLDEAKAKSCGCKEDCSCKKSYTTFKEKMNKAAC